jgi:hypothetical protein
VNALVFLFLALVLSGIGAFVLWLRHRSPSTMDSGIDAFQREMEALAPPGDAPVPRRRTARPQRPGKGR